MDSVNDSSYNALTEVRRVKCPCRTCAKFSGEYEDTGNGQHIVYCEDGKIRCTTVESGCAWWEQDPFEGVTDVN